MRDKFIRELSDQANQDLGDRGTNINIHFPLRGEISNYCIRLNQEIQKLTKSDIDFSPRSFQVPHLTLYMGFVNSEQNYNAVLDEIYSLAQEMKAIKITVTKPYIKEPEKNYVFVGTGQSNQIIQLKRLMKEKNSKWIEPLDWDVVSELPHITVAYIQDNFDKVEKLLQDYPLGTDWIGDSFEISYVGLQGSCLGSIRTFEFP